MKNILILVSLIGMLLLITGCFESSEEMSIENDSLLKRSTGSKIKIYYSNNGVGGNIHYNADSNGWTEAPGEPMTWINDDNPFNQYKGHYVKEFDAVNLEFVFTDYEGNNWDNNNGQNYFIDRPGTYLVENGEIKPAYEGVAFIEYNFENIESRYEYLDKEINLYKDGEFFKTVKISNFVSSSKPCTRITRLENASYEVEIKITREDGTMHFAREYFYINDFAQSVNKEIDVKQYEMVTDKIVIYYSPKRIQWKHSPEGINIHYNAENNGWTSFPGINALAKSYKYEIDDRFGDIKAKYEIDAQSVEFCFNYLGEEWDNNNESNYKIDKPGIYEVSTRRIKELATEMIEE